MEKMRELKRRVRTDSGLIKTVLNVFQRRYLMKTTMKSQACCYLEGKVNNFGISESLSLVFQVPVFSLPATGWEIDYEACWS